ncbi:MAG: response regulator [Chloroflexi bacterium]|nr:response regulator [Chloroflexota bacterium]
MSATNPSSPAGKIRILIVDDIVETRENVRKLLYFEKDIEVVGTASNGREGVELAVKLQPDVVLMDINMPEMDGIAASEALSAQAPNVQVVMMSVQGESDYLRRSMLAGAREFLIKPFSGEELVTSIHRVYQFAATRRAAAPPPPTAPTTAAPTPPPRGGKVIAILGSKGGSGATTIAVNLAVALREETKARIALVDANLEFGDVGVLLNLPSNRTIADLASGKTDIDEEVLDGTLAAHSSALKVLLAPSRPELAELVKLEHLKRIMELLDKSYDFVIIDLWKSFQESTVFFLDHADLILLIATTDIPSIKNSKLFFELTEQLGYPPDKTLFVLNKEDGRSGISARDIEASVKHPVSLALPKDERSTTIAINRGTPFVMLQKNLPLSQKIYDLARLVLRRAQPDKESAAPDKAAAKKK